MSDPNFWSVLRRRVRAPSRHQLIKSFLEETFIRSRSSDSVSVPCPDVASVPSEWKFPGGNFLLKLQAEWGYICE